MSRVERLKGYANPASRQHWHGQSTQQNINRWSERATRESNDWHRAKIGPEPELPGDSNVAGPSYGTLAGAGSGVGRIEAAHATARRDKNHSGGSHLRHVRRS